ncbi:putative glucomannan 4-beta-mannosyltransferase [Helianthus anomalus]
MIVGSTSSLVSKIFKFYNVYPILLVLNVRSVSRLGSRIRFISQKHFRYFFSLLGYVYSVWTLILGMLKLCCLAGSHEGADWSHYFQQLQEAAGVWCLKAIEDISGWKDRTTMEDMDHAVRYSLKGWIFVFGTQGGLSNGYKSHIAEKELTVETYSPDDATAMHNNKVVHLHPVSIKRAFKI